ncbi:MAG: phosphoenolpyruvate synthase/pyruvate phosphate dikinase [Desulfosarcina sp.]|nr:phosphoenolpyruvate synthase/pyruvate phosphate dikinase [Desulfosarcina sp.]
MALNTRPFFHESDSRFKLFHELMARKVRHILLVSTPYDAWIMEEDCRLSERIVNEYRGLNLSQPPRLTWVSSAEQALAALDDQAFDMVITMPRLADMRAAALGHKIKKKAPGLPIILLSHDTIPSPEIKEPDRAPGIDRTFVWSGNTDILVALTKSTEDRMNAEKDTQAAGVRVILFVEDSPYYLSCLLPILYRELVSQTQAVMEGTLNEEHRLVTMRARPKILVAGNYEEALTLYERYESNVLGVISDVRFSRNGTLNETAGVDFLKHVRARRFDVPLLLTSSETANAPNAASIPAAFVDKNSGTLHQDVHRFFKDQLGFGDFVFRLPDGSEIGRASNLKALEQHMLSIPEASFRYHCNRNDFSRWLFARTEMALAAEVRPISDDDFSDDESHRRHLVKIIADRRKRRQKGVVADFDAADADFDTEFFKIGKGSLGGKARGLAFVASLLRQNPDFYVTYKGVDIIVPQTLVITTDGFESFVEDNGLRYLSKTDLPDEQIADLFLAGRFPGWIEERLQAYLAQVTYPLAIRSSSLLEDAQFRAYAGLYRTYMITNDCPDAERRLKHLVHAIKLVYASTYYKGPKAFSKRVGHRTEEEQMAVIIQKLVGSRYGDSFYPAISGVAQSHNYYPFARMKPEEGIVTIAMGLGKTVVEGEKTLRFSPAHPQVLPQRSTVEDILDNAQRHFYALKMEKSCHSLETNDGANLWYREVTEAENEQPMQLLASTYVPDEHRIRDTVHIPGQRVLTFAHILKYREFPLADILKDMLELGEQGMGCPVEMEFSVNLTAEPDHPPQFAFLQLRPMTARAELEQVNISTEEIENAFCFSGKALGNALKQDMADIILVKPEAFDPGRTMEIAREIARINATLVKEDRKYLLVGPGRWGSADRWLGIPVAWADISGVGAMIETESDKLVAEPSQGSHFFHNITTLGINYITVSKSAGDWLDWNWLTALPRLNDATFVAHVRLESPVTLKVDGRQSQCVIVKGSGTGTL